MNPAEKIALIFIIVESFELLEIPCQKDHIQAIMYFLKSIYPILDIDFNFTLVKNTPYSEDLDRLLNDLKKLKYLLFGVESIRVDYNVINKLKEVVSGEFYSLNRIRIQHIIARILNRSLKELKLVMTAMYLLNQNRWVDDGILLKELKQLKPEYPIVQITSALETAKKIKNMRRL